MLQREDYNFIWWEKQGEKMDYKKSWGGKQEKKTPNQQKPNSPGEQALF